MNKLKRFQIMTIGLTLTLIGLSAPAAALDASKCTAAVGTLFNGQMTGTFCVSKIAMNNWFSAFSWCKAVGGHLASRDEACNYAISSCNNIKGSGRTGYAWLADPKGEDSAYTVELSSGSMGTAYYGNNRNVNSYAALCK